MFFPTTKTKIERGDRRQYFAKEYSFTQADVKILIWPGLALKICRKPDFWRGSGGPFQTFLMVP